VLVHRDGRREILIYDDDDPDACSSLVTLTRADTRTISELLGASQVTEVVSVVQQRIDGLAIEWIEISGTAATVNTTIGDGRYRTKTGASIVAVVRKDESIPAPEPDFELIGGDVVVAVGTDAGLAKLRELLRT
jgi:TrkA domain protein